VGVATASTIRPAHDDIINAAAGAIVMAARRKAQEVPIVAPIVIGRTATISGGTISTEAAWREWTYGRSNTGFWGPV
jgi:crotonobetainyl-CoA:carnitine CoA-transferase CaiB-like acyl-CoA transferase